MQHFMRSEEIHSKSSFPQQSEDTTKGTKEHNYR